jgi:molybdopterin-guanine dinucleotide biosynthesis protein A
VTCSGYVLAGGRSSRMGRDKALLPFRGGILAAAVAREVEHAAGSVTLVGHPDLGGIPDLYPGEGPLGGILTALHHTSADWNLIVACDLPRISADFLRGILAEAFRSPAPILLPCGPGGRPEPLCAAYHRRALAGLEAAFARGIRKVTAAMEGLGALRLNVDEMAVFQNVNTPEDWSGYGAE